MADNAMESPAPEGERSKQHGTRTQSQRDHGAEHTTTLTPINEDRPPMITLSNTAPQTHIEFVIDFLHLPPEVDFEVKISGPVRGSWWGTLKSDPEGHAQLIWRTPARGKYTVEAKGGEGDTAVNVSESFEVTSMDPDEEYRAEKRAAARKSQKGQKAKAAQPSGNIGTVEEPAVMGDPELQEAKRESEESLSDEDKQNPLINDPKFKTAQHDPADQGDPVINKEIKDPETAGGAPKKTKKGDSK